VRTVFLTIGPQGAGKSTFCKKAVTQHPSIIWISRDEILTRLFGTVWLNPYTGGHQLAFECMWRIVQKHLRKPDAVLLLDCWNGFGSDRALICRELRLRGAECIIGLHFVISEKACVKWRALKELDTKGISADEYAHDYRLFQAQPIEVEQGFDSIIRIQPALVSDYSFLLGSGEQLCLPGC